jgi:small subunit ribosomal protein S20
MATHKSAEKRHRQSLKRRDRNRSAVSEIKTTLKNALSLAEKGDNEGALKAAKAATKLLDTAASKGIVHKNNAKRRISRLFSKIGSSKKPTTAKAAK